MPKVFLLRYFPSSLPLLVLGLLCSSCSTSTDLREPQELTKYTVENTARFTVAEPSLQNLVSCTGLVERRLEDGRLEVTVNIKSRSLPPLRLKAQCLFRDAQGLFVEDAPWQAFSLEEGTTQTLRFKARRPEALLYSIKVKSS